MEKGPVKFKNKSFELKVKLYQYCVFLILGYHSQSQFNLIFDSEQVL